MCEEFSFPARSRSLLLPWAPRSRLPLPASLPLPHSLHDDNGSEENTVLIYARFAAAAFLNFDSKTRDGDDDEDEEDDDGG